MVRAGTVGGLVLVLIVVLFSRFATRQTVDSDYRELALAVVREAEFYDQYHEYYDWLARDAHGPAFDAAFSQELGSRRRAGRVVMDDELYLTELFRLMILSAERDNSPQVAHALRELRDEIFYPDE